jgi:hypothetical protein
MATAIARLAGSNASMHDVGAGKGLYVHFWRGCGLQVTGEDGAVNIDSITGGTVVHRDASTYSIDCDPASAVDVVTALEIAEHIPKKFEPRFLKHVTCMASRALVLSWAHPGQAGNGHVNPATLEDVKEKLRPLGWTLQQEWTNELRRSAKVPWFKKNVAVYVPADATSALPSPRPSGADTPKQSGMSATSPMRLRASLAQAMASIAELNGTTADTGLLVTQAVGFLRTMQAELARLPV